MAQGPDRLALLSFAGASVLAGGNAVGVRFSNRELDPLWGAGLRFGLAAGILLLVMAVMRLPVPRGRALAGALVYGLLNFGGGFALAYYALVSIQAGLGQTLLALVPLVTLLLAVLQGDERLRLLSVVGTVLALAGVAVVSSTPLRGSVPALSLLAALGSVLCLSQAAVLAHRFPAAHPVAVNAVGMTTGAAALLAGSLVARESWRLPERAETWLALAYLVPVGSVLVFVLYLVVLQRWAASRAAYVVVIAPIFAIALSAWLDDEPVTSSLVIGGLLVLAGVYTGALRPARDKDGADDLR
ncbi:DMT family transporter [Longispora albida]|uniref:DMT family transporter n=1 Tax=Longispora albida TaxID=203523 RepID=UPI00036862E2|nr:DMT family transporter [Longispora albida]